MRPYRDRTPARILTTLLTTLLLSTAGCLSSAKVQFEHPSFEDTDLSDLQIVAFVDERGVDDLAQDRDSIALKDSQVGRSDKRLKKRRYVPEWTELEVPAPAPEGDAVSLSEAASALPAGSPQKDWVLVLSIEELSGYNAFIWSSGSARLNARLYNRESGELWWHATGSARMSWGFLFAPFVDEKLEAINVVVEKVLRKLPKQPK